MRAFARNASRIEDELARLAQTPPGAAGVEGAGLPTTLEWLRRPESSYSRLRHSDAVAAMVPDDVAFQVETTVKYDGYIRRQERQIAQSAPAGNALALSRYRLSGDPRAYLARRSSI